MENVEGLSMENILKKVYDVHRKILSDSNTSLNKYKTGYARLVEKTKQLQAEKTKLQTENRHLQSDISKNTSRSGSCCEVIRDSLETVITSYKQLLQDKDARIKQLEEELRCRKRGLPSQDLEYTPDRPFNSTKRMGKKVPLAKQSPDSTSLAPPTVSPAKSDHNQSPVKKSQNTYPRNDFSSSSSQSKQSKLAFLTPEKCNNLSPKNKSLNQKDAVTKETKVKDKEEFDDLVFDEALEMVKKETQKPKLQMRRSKRSRYSEEISPEIKRQRQRSPGSSKTLVPSPVSSTAPRKPAVLVPDTCGIGLDDSVDQHRTEKQSVAKVAQTGLKAAHKQEEEFNTDMNLFIVPETLAMDMDIDLSEEENTSDASETKKVTGMKKKKFEPELSDINEASAENSGRGSGMEKLSRNSKDKHHDDKAKVKSSDRSGCLEDDDDIPFSLTSVLNSPTSEKGDSDGEKHIQNAVNHHTLNLSGNSVCLDSDGDDLEEDTLKDEDHDTQVTVKCARTNSQALRLDEINEMFETPEKSLNGKQSDAMSSDDIERKSIEEKQKKKPLFKKNLNDIEKNDDIVLRRSPRKHNQVDFSPKKKTVLSPKLENCKKRSSHTNNVGTASESVEVTDNERQELQEEVQSLDVYNIVPVKNGVPVTTKMFQCKVPKSGQQGLKNLHKDSSKSKMKLVQSSPEKSTSRSDKGNKTLKSPSILDVGERSRVTGVIDLCSPNLGSVSDPESPLLLQGSSKGTGSQTKTNSQNRRTKRFTSQGLSTENQTEAQQSDISKSTKNRLTRNLPRRASQQTTLTQGFFSPEKRSGKKKQASEDEDLKKALALSLVEAEKGKQTDTFSFKKPAAPQKQKASIRRLDIDKTHDNDVDKVVDLDETMAPDDDITEYNRSSALGEVRDQRLNIQVGVQGVNGSLDPAVELSLWCEEPATVDAMETEAGETVTTLPSLDEDFCMADLHHAEDTLQKTSTLAVEDSQDIPSSSTSYKFGPRKKIGNQAKNEDIENLDPRATSQTLDDSFDRPPKKSEPKVAHVTVVRKKDERQKLQGHSCKSCLEYYNAAGLGEEEIKHHMQQCSRHRAEYIPPDTPPHFWSVGFIDTQECVDRGYMKVETAAKKTVDEPKFRRRRRLNKYFKSKNETSTLEPDSLDDL